MIDDFLLQSQVTKYHRLGAGTPRLIMVTRGGGGGGCDASSTWLNVLWQCLQSKKFSIM